MIKQPKSRGFMKIREVGGKDEYRPFSKVGMWIRQIQHLSGSLVADEEFTSLCFLNWFVTFLEASIESSTLVQKSVTEEEPTPEVDDDETTAGSEFFRFLLIADDDCCSRGWCCCWFLKSKMGIFKVWPTQTLLLVHKKLFVLRRSSTVMSYFKAIPANVSWSDTMWVRHLR